MQPPRTKPSLLFRLVVPATVVFILTILSLIAAVFGDPMAPVAVWLDANGNTLLIWEFIAVVVLSLLAMTVDRIRTLKGIDEEPIPVPERNTDAVNASPESSPPPTAPDSPT